jgi:hypothetical protein
VTLTDNGGTANGGDDTSATKVFSLTITRSTTAASSRAATSRPEDAGSQSVPGWATSISEVRPTSRQTVSS